ncbi:hypothetical protein FRC10_010336 [Ceratobasidium sp. 414]|nr:hypothetical protein FRC10_010336 [Ceratobasidium sp. 414]
MPRSAQREGSVLGQQGDQPRDGQPARDLSPPPPPKRHQIILSAKKRTTDEYGIAARMVTRTVKMNWEPFAVVNAGVLLTALAGESAEAADAEYDSATDKKRAIYDIFYLLCDRIPGFEDTEKWAGVRSRLDDGKSAARTEDNHTLKHALPKWMIWNPPLKPNSKSDRGLNHPECARRLAPISVDWNNEEQRNNFLIQNDPPMTAAQHWPAFLYLDLKGDVNDMSKGLLRGALMVKGARAIIFPASVANTEDEPDHRSNRKSKATTYGMTAATPGFLAYVAVGVRYALSSEPTFMSTGGLFNYERFYNDIVTYLTQPVCKVETDKLIEWWNIQLFPRQAADPVEEPGGMIAELIRQAEARRELENNN